MIVVKRDAWLIVVGSFFGAVMGKIVDYTLVDLSKRWWVFVIFMIGLLLMADYLLKKAENRNKINSTKSHPLAWPFLICYFLFGVLLALYLRLYYL